MKPFESFLGPKMEEYIQYRYTLGYTTKDLRTCLLHFDRYLKKTHGSWDSLKPSFFLEFIRSLNKEPNSVNRILLAVRGFFQFLIRQDILEQNPLQDIPPLPERFYIPFVFSSQDTERLIHRVRERIRQTPEHFLKDFAVYMAILMQARCGLRLREPTRLLLSHYRAQEKTIYIEKTKFKKDRLIPIPESLANEITNYLAVRRSLVHDDHNPYLLYADKERKLSAGAICPAFHQAVKDCGLYRPRHVIGNHVFGSPTPHSFRHSFAINTLKRIKGRGKSPEHALSVLAAYMGHTDYQYTAVYLKVLDAKQREAWMNFTLSNRGKL